MKKVEHKCCRPVIGEYIVFSFFSKFCAYSNVSKWPIFRHIDVDTAGIMPFYSFDSDHVQWEMHTCVTGGTIAQLLVTSLARLRTALHIFSEFTLVQFLFEIHKYLNFS